MRMECRDCTMLLLGYCSGDICAKFSRNKIENHADSTLDFEKVKEENLEKSLKNLITSFIK